MTKYLLYLNEEMVSNYSLWSPGWQLLSFEKYQKAGFIISSNEIVRCSNGMYQKLEDDHGITVMVSDWESEGHGFNP